MLRLTNFYTNLESISQTLEQNIRRTRYRIQNKLKILPLKTIIICLTSKCNLKCKMCDIWAQEEVSQKDISISKLMQILGSNKARTLRHITFTGGEPFLRSDLQDIYNVSAFSKPKTRFMISSNGTLTEAIVRFCSKINQKRRISLEFSLHGIDYHNQITQTQDSFKRSMETIIQMQAKFAEVRLGLKFVISPWNYQDIEKVADFCKQKRLPLQIKLIENVKSYTNSIYFKENEKENKFNFSLEQKGYIIKALKKLGYKYTINIRVLKKMIRFLEGKVDYSWCSAPMHTLFINAIGDIYRCRNYDPIGNINTVDIDKLNFEKDYLSKIKNLQKDKCSRCVCFLRYIA